MHLERGRIRPGRRAEFHAEGHSPADDSAESSASAARRPFRHSRSGYGRRVDVVTDALGPLVGRSVTVLTEVARADGWVCISVAHGVLTPPGSDDGAGTWFVGEHFVLQPADDADAVLDAPFVRVTMGSVRFSVAPDPPDHR
jgi:hypothetical protein